MVAVSGREARDGWWGGEGTNWLVFAEDGALSRLRRLKMPGARRPCSATIVRMRALEVGGGRRAGRGGEVGEGREGSWVREENRR